MAKKPTVYNHIDNVTVNINYEQLAKAILKEQKKEENKRKKRIDARRFLMSWCNGSLYALFYSYVVLEIVKMWKKYVSAGEGNLYMCIIYTVGSVSLAILLFLAHQETMNDSKEETITYFNTNIVLVALIVSIVALLKG